MNLFNFLGRWWGLLIVVLTLAAAGVLGWLIDSKPFSILIGMICGVVGGCIMIQVGSRYDR